MPGSGRRSVAPGPLLALAWCEFQPRTVALAAALGGRAAFLPRGGRRADAVLLPLRYLRAAVWTWRVLGRADPGAVYVITPPVFAPIVAAAWCALRHRPLLMDCHTDAFHSRKWGWALPIHRWLARRATAVTLHTRPMAAEAETWGAPALLLPDDVPHAGLAAPQPRGAGPRVVVAGALDAQEPVALTLEAARLLPEVEFRLTGDPNRVPAEVRAAAPANAVFTGWLDYPRFLGELLAADVVAAFSTDPQIMNRAAFEAVGLHRPLVLTDFEGLRERFGEAALFAANTATAMAGALRAALRDRDQLAGRSVRLAERLRAQAAEGMAQVRRRLEGQSPRRVLMISQHPYPFASVLRRNVDELLEAGVELDLVCTADGPPMAASPHPRLRIARVAVKHRRTPSFWYVIEYLTFFVGAAGIVSWLGLRRRYDTVQVDNLPDFLVFSAFVPRLRGARVVLHMWEVMPEMTAARLDLPVRHPLVRVATRLEGWATRWVDHVIAVSEACRRVLTDRGVPADKISVVFNTQPALPTPERARPTAPVLMTHGTLVARYGVQVAIEALALLRDDWPGVTLRVIGGGEYLPALRALALRLGLEGQVTFHPWLSFAHLLAEIRGATIGIVPVIADRYGPVILPTKLFDYVAEGVPAVCSRLPAVEECFPADSVAYFAPGNAVELAAQVDRLLRQPEQARAQAERATAVMAQIGWERMAPRYRAALGTT